MSFKKAVRFSKAIHCGASPAVLLALALLPSAAFAADRCTWLNAATASGFLGGSVTSQTADDTTCNFIRRDGSRVSALRIETETLHSPAEFKAYATRCHSATSPLKVIGNEALACSDNSGAEVAEQVVSRVRNQAFLVRISTNDRSADPAALRDKVRKIAEQVAGILF